jgi:hypothetical protein
MPNGPNTVIPDASIIDTGLGNPEIPEPEPSEHETMDPGHDVLTPPQAVVIDQFPFGSPGMPIPGKPKGLSAHESWRAASMDSPWAPFRSELDWNVARWVKMRGPSSTAVAELLAIPGVSITC